MDLASSHILLFAQSCWIHSVFGVKGLQQSLVAGLAICCSKSWNPISLTFSLKSFLEYAGKPASGRTQCSSKNQLPNRGDPLSLFIHLCIYLISWRPEGSFKVAQWMEGWVAGYLWAAPSCSSTFPWLLTRAAGKEFVGERGKSPATIMFYFHCRHRLNSPCRSVGFMAHIRLWWHRDTDADQLTQQSSGAWEKSVLRYQTEKHSCLPTLGMAGQGYCAWAAVIFPSVSY